MAGLRRGLPRAIGGEPWPPADLVVDFDAAVAADRGASDARLEAVAGAKADLATGAGADADLETPTASAPQLAAVGVAASQLRRGLPRAIGGEPWPPAGLVVDVGAVVPAGRGAAAPAETVAGAATPAASAPRPAASGVATSVRRGLPRAVGGEPWPPADLALAFEAPVAGAAAVPLVPVADGAASAAPAEIAADSSTPASSAPQPAAVPAPRPATAPVLRGPAVRRKPSRFTGDQVFGGLTALVAGGVTLLVLATAIVFLVRMFLFGTQAGADFLAAFPGTTALPDWAPSGQPLWAQWQHWLNAFFIVLIIKTGWTVRVTTRPSAMWQPKGANPRRVKMSIELWMHNALDVVWLANGVIFWVLLFVTGQWVRVVPVSWDIFPNALSAALQYVSLSWPTEDGWVNYNSLQVLAYFVTIFIAAPLAAVTGWRMSAMWPSRATRLSKAYPVELARAVHFPVMLYFIAFIIVHVVLVLATGALRNLNHMFWGSDDAGSWLGFWVFVVSIVVIVGGWFAIRPAVMQRLGSVFGRVGR